MCLGQKGTWDLFGSWCSLFACFIPGSAAWSCSSGDRIENLERVRDELKERLSELEKELERLKKNRAEEPAKG